MFAEASSLRNSSATVNGQKPPVPIMHRLSELLAATGCEPALTIADLNGLIRGLTMRTALVVRVWSDNHAFVSVQ